MLNQIDLSRTDLNLLVLFDAVLQNRHVGKTAAQLNLSPSAVSHGLGRLRRLLNDPLFLRTPKGVVPTARALELAMPVSDALARVRAVIGGAEPFDPATSTRRFIIGAPDGVSAAFLSPLLATLARCARGIDLGLRQLLPPDRSRQFGRAWDAVLADLEARAVDVAIVPLDQVPARFAASVVYQEDFVIAVRRRHPFAADPTLTKFCAGRHVVVSLGGDAYGFVDDALAARGLARRVALTVPNFMMALSTIADSDLIGALPRRFVLEQGGRFGIVSVEAPLSLPRFPIRAVVPKVALQDAGLAWLFKTLQEVTRVDSWRSPVRKRAR
jgi:DNA-binding transcriptional LysR family regulator